MTEAGMSESTRFQPGNRFWQARSRSGLRPTFETPEALWDACEEYFEWCEDNPLWEEKGFSFQGVVTKERFAKMRAMTAAGLCLFLGIAERTWRDWRQSRPDLLPVITRVEAVIYTQKFAGAAADLLNPNIIARDLGLADRQEHTGKDGGPVVFTTIYET
jgi:hypothetical protein